MLTYIIYVIVSVKKQRKTTNLSRCTTSLHFVIGFSLLLNEKRANGRSKKIGLPQCVTEVKLKILYFYLRHRCTHESFPIPMPHLASFFSLSSLPLSSQDSSVVAHTGRALVCRTVDAALRRGKIHQS